MAANKGFAAAIDLPEELEPPNTPEAAAARSEAASSRAGESHKAHVDATLAAAARTTSHETEPNRRQSPTGALTALLSLRARAA